jgi:hypothetical protein
MAASARRGEELLFMLEEVEFHFFLILVVQCAQPL